jgi:hypothetical protein
MNWLKNHPKGLAIALGALWLLFWGLHLVGSYWEDQYPVHEIPWQLQWFTETFENQQSEMFQIMIMVIFTSLLIYKGSAESRDSNDRMEEKIDAISTRLFSVENTTQSIERHMPWRNPK